MSDQLVDAARDSTGTPAEEDDTDSIEENEKIEKD
jgi:hypothetical protein